MAWADLAVQVLEEFGAVSLLDSQRGAWDRWRARRTDRERVRRREMRERHTWQIRQLRAAERRRVAGTEWARMAASFQALPARTGTGGVKPWRRTTTA